MVLLAKLGSRRASSRPLRSSAPSAEWSRPVAQPRPWRALCRGSLWRRHRSCHPGLRRSRRLRWAALPTCREKSSCPPPSLGIRSTSMAGSLGLPMCSVPTTRMMPSDWTATSAADVEVGGVPQPGSGTEHPRSFASRRERGVELAFAGELGDRQRAVGAHGAVASSYVRAGTRGRLASGCGHDAPATT